MKSRTFTKILSAFLAVTVLLVAAPFFEMTDLFSLKVSAETYSGSCGATDQDNVNWSFDTETGELDITGEGEMADFLFLSSVPWYSYSESIKKVNIANGVKSIGKDAFSGSVLESVTISESVTRIGDWAFYSCEKLTSVVIPDSVISIGEWAFHSCTKLATVKLSDNLVSMGDGAFAYCESLDSVEIPESVTDIGHFSFYGCISVEAFVVDSDNKNYSSDSFGVLYNKDKTKLIQYPMGNGRESYVIPDSVKYIDDELLILVQILNLL